MIIISQKSNRRVATRDKNELGKGMIGKKKRGKGIADEEKTRGKVQRSYG